MLRAFDDLVRQGKILYTACSNYEAWRLMEALWLSDSNGWARFAAYQPQYSLVVRDIDEEIVPACEAKGLGVVAWSPLASGFLTDGFVVGRTLRVSGGTPYDGDYEIDTITALVITLQTSTGADDDTRTGVRLRGLGTLDEVQVDVLDEGRDLAPVVTLDLGPGQCRQSFAPNRVA